jgi:hypothetical protein
VTENSSVQGAEQFLALSKSLKQNGQTELRKELNKTLKTVTKPLIAKTRATARQTLPAAGGLAALVAKEPQRTQVRTGMKTAGVRIVVGRKGGGARAADSGTIRHPVFGGDQWVTQRVPSGWFSDTLREHAPAIRPDLVNAMEDIAKKVVRDAKRGG